jgi:putative redox protein
MEHQIQLKWTGDMSFETEVNGHKMTLDAAEKVGGKNRGPRPKPLLLVALAGCTSMDVISLLNKMRVEYDDFFMDIDGDVSEDHPKYYTHLRLVYNIKGDSIDQKKVEKAIKLSQEKYCGVNFMLGKAADISYQINYL